MFAYHPALFLSEKYNLCVHLALSGTPVIIFFDGDE